MPVVSAETTLPGFRRFRQRTASRAVIKNNFVAVLIKNPGRSYHERIDSIAREFQQLRVIRQQPGQNAFRSKQERAQEAELAAKIEKAKENTPKLGCV